MLGLILGYSLSVRPVSHIGLLLVTRLSSFTVAVGLSLGSVPRVLLALLGVGILGFLGPGVFLLRIGVSRARVRLVLLRSALARLVGAVAWRPLLALLMGAILGVALLVVTAVVGAALGSGVLRAGTLQAAVLGASTLVTGALRASVLGAVALGSGGLLSLLVTLTLLASPGPLLSSPSRRYLSRGTRLLGRVRAIICRLLSLLPSAIGARMIVPVVGGRAVSIAVALDVAIAVSRWQCMSVSCRTSAESESLRVTSRCHVDSLWSGQLGRKHKRTVKTKERMTEAQG